MKKTLSLFIMLMSFYAVQAQELIAYGYNNVPDSLMNVSVYKKVTLSDSELPIKMSKTKVNFNKEYKVATKGENISKKLQDAIDKYSAKGGAQILISKGDYLLSNVELKSNIHLLFDKDVILRPYSEDISSVTMFSVGKGSGTKPTVENISIQGVGGRVDVILPDNMQGFDSKFIFISSTLVKDFYYTNFNIYDHKTVISSLNFGPAERNAENYIGSTNGVVKDITVIDAHYGYGLVQMQAGRNVRFYNLHGIGGITLRLETGSGPMNKAQFGGVFDIEAENISVANGHGGVACWPHGMKNGVCHIKNVTALSSGGAFEIGEQPEGSADFKSSGHAGTFGAGTSVKNVTAKFGFNAQLKTKDLLHTPREYWDMIGKPGTRAIIEPAPAHTCVSITTNVPIEYDESTFKAIGFKYGDPIRIGGIITKEERTAGTKEVFSYIMKKYNLKTLNSKAPEFSEKNSKKQKNN